MSFSQEVRESSKLHTFIEVLYLNLLRINLYRILDLNIKDTNVRKLVKIRILKESKFNSDLNYMMNSVISIMKTQIFSKSLGLKHPSVKKVKEIAEEIMSKNKLLNVENLYNIAKKRLNLSRNSLLCIIQFLINKKILIEGSKFSKETALLNDNRRIIYNFIKLNPGVHFSLLRKKALSGESGSSGQLVWHLEMLLKFNYIDKTKVGNYTIFFPIEMEVDFGIMSFLLRDTINLKIIDLLTKQKSLKKSEIYKLLDEKRDIVNYRINNLINYDLIRSIDDDTKDLYINSDKKKDIHIILNNYRNKLNKI
ncbi:MAG: hypothetical protein ACFFCV_14090 [Promethearchaeota archaeon]